MCTTCLITRRAVIAGLAALPLAACDEAPEIALVTDAEVEAAGRAAWADISGQTPPSRDEGFRAALAEVAGRMLRAAGEDPGAWRVAAFGTDQVNAFVVPGRAMGVYEGLWRVAGGHDALAAVVGHEIGHLDADHAKERMTAERAGDLTQRLVGAVLRASEVELAAEIGAAVGVGLQYGVLLPYSRRQELEADRLGVRLMAAAGYDPRAALSFWERMEAARATRLPSILATHPAPADRIAELEAEIAAL